MEVAKIGVMLGNQIMIINLLGAIFHNQTGKVPVVDVDTKNGTLKLYPIIDSVKYRDGAESCLAGQQKANHIGA